MAWVPVVIETGRDALQFDLVLRGDPVDDFFVFGIGESNLFTMSAAYIPAESVSSGPLFDLSAWSGEAVDLFFGFVGGTSSNAELEISEIRFYALNRPSIAIEKKSDQLLISWPARFGFSVLQTSGSLTQPDWRSVIGAPLVKDDMVGVSFTPTGDGQVFRLKDD